MSLRLKIAAALAALAGIIAALAAGGAYVTAARQLDRTIDETLLERASAAVNDTSRPGRGEPGNRQPIMPGRARCPDVDALQTFTAAQLIDDGEVRQCIVGGATIEPTERDLAIANGTDTHADDHDGAADADYAFSRARIGNETVRVITMAFPDGGAIQLARETGEADRVLDGLRIRLLLIALTGIVVAAAVGFALATRIVRPIRRLTTTAEHIAATRDLTTPVPAAGSDEIGSLSASFTTMVESLAESQDQQQRLISDASHEMRTPLTSLRTNLELLARAELAAPGSLSAEDRRAVIDDLQFETGELTALLTELVELATDRAGGEESVPVDLTVLTSGVAERARRRTGRAISVVGPDGTGTGTGTGTGVVVTVRQHMIERAVSNLIDNAVKYSPDGAPVDVIVDGTRVEVRDHGNGIAAADLPRIFDRFYRATEARTAPGSGLGLAIVSQIVEGHGGRVFAGNHGGGAAVGFELPAPPA
ncbi:MAG: HAMP domain-containing sensor histidine kinase [Microthrixaceae bacterium]